MNCGREKGGLMAKIYGECPIPGAMKFDGMNEGIGGGRACWIVRPTACRAAMLNKQRSCRECDFYRRVVHEQEEKTHFRFVSEPH